jgi:hypothetical protein
MTNQIATSSLLSQITDFKFPGEWVDGSKASQRAKECCAKLEEGGILYFDNIPFNFPEADREFLLSQKQSEFKGHKNISYRPKQDMIRGAAGSHEDISRMHGIMRGYSAEVTKFLSKLLAPYAAHWALDFASYRPEQEQGRDLALHKRNDLLHVDSFPTRPMHGNRILRCFTNINPSEPRVWHTTADRFPKIAESFAADAGLAQIAARRGHSPLLLGLKKMVGMKAVAHSPYDRFMLRFHDYLKEKTDFQQNTPKQRIDFPPGSTWICYTDSVPHAVLSGQYALEQTFIIPLRALVTPEQSPIRILEKMAGRPLAAA